MAISGVGQSYYQNNVATTKSTKSVNSTGETGNTKELSEAEEMAIFKKEFYAEIDKIPRNRTITNVAINIYKKTYHFLFIRYSMGDSPVCFLKYRPR